MKMKLNSYIFVTTTHIIEVVDKAVVDGSDKIANLTPVWSLTLKVLLCHMVY